MTARDNAASIQGEVIRITPLLIDGSIDPDRPILTTEGFISASFGTDVEEGDEITEKAANGKICIQYKADDSMKGVTFNLSLCSPDPEASALLAGGKVLARDDGGVIEITGYTSPPVGGIIGNPVAIEIWSKAIINGKPAGNKPYWHWVFPYVRVRYDGDREFTNGALANEFSGVGVGNDALAATGLNPANSGDDFVLYRSALENPFSYVRDYSKPAVGWSGSFNTDDTDIATVVTVSEITGVTAGAPATFTPPGSATPETISELNELLPSPTPTTEWPERAIGEVGQWAVLGDSSKVRWTGTAWNTVINTSLDVSDLVDADVTAEANLVALKADVDHGDGAFTGGTFDTGQFIVIADASTAHYSAGAWTAGAMP